jgi:hypothetical protein
MKPKAVVAVLCCTLLWALSADAQKQLSADAQKEPTIQSDENGEIKLTQPTKVGDLTLQPATYVLEHHVTRRQDFIRFMQVKRERKLMVTRAYTGWYTDRELIKAGEAKCRMEPLGAKAQASTVNIANEDGTLRITQATVKGKAAVYVF